MRDADAHYDTFGWHEGRDPNAFFSTRLLSLGQSRRAGGRRQSARAFRRDRLAARTHSLARLRPGGLPRGQSRRRGRACRSAAALSCSSATRKAASRSRRPRCSPPTASTIVYYLAHNPDVAAAHVDPLQHFRTFGWKEGRDPNALFDTSGYLAAYADVKAAGINPLDHYNTFGWREGRDPSADFDTERLSRRLSGRGGRARQPAAPLPAPRHPRRPFGLRGRRVRIDPTRLRATRGGTLPASREGLRDRHAAVGHDDLPGDEARAGTGEKGRDRRRSRPACRCGAAASRRCGARGPPRSPTARGRSRS